MILVITVLLIIAASIVTVAVRESYKEKVEVDKNELNNAEVKECGCGKTNDVNGKCDGSHMSDV